MDTGQQHPDKECHRRPTKPGNFGARSAR